MILDQTNWAIAEKPAWTASGHAEIIRRTVTKKEATELRLEMFKTRQTRARYVVIPLKGKRVIR